VSNGPAAVTHDHYLERFQSSLDNGELLARRLDRESLASATSHSRGGKPLIPIDGVAGRPAFRVCVLRVAALVRVANVVQPLIVGARTTDDAVLVHLKFALTTASRLHHDLTE
jgi:hypothetical protein